MVTILLSTLPCKAAAPEAPFCPLAPPSPPIVNPITSSSEKADVPPELLTKVVVRL